jgi:radical SAM-linked protein
MRVRFQVDGACRFLPHHDLMRAFQRAARLAGLPLRFSQGFSPHPRMAFGPPLPMAIGGERELFDLELERAVPDLAEQLNAGLPPGLRCVAAVPVPRAARSIAAGVRAADYRAELPAIGSNGAREALRRRVDAFQAADAVPVTKSRPGKPDRTIDLKRAVRDLEFEHGDGGAVAVRFQLVVQEPAGHETRAQTVLAQVLGLDAPAIAAARITRLAMRDADGQTL